MIKFIVFLALAIAGTAACVIWMKPSDYMILFVAPTFVLWLSTGFSYLEYRKEREERQKKMKQEE